MEPRNLYFQQVPLVKTGPEFEMIKVGGRSYLLLWRTTLCWKGSWKYLSLYNLDLESVQFQRI